MYLIEIKHPTGALNAADRTTLAASVVAALAQDEPGAAGSVPEETMRRARTMTHVGFHDLTDWSTGDGPWNPELPAPMWVTITVPEAWRDETARHVIGWLRRAVRQIDDQHGWRRNGGDLWLNVVGVADGSIGRDGKPSTADDVLEFMTAEFRAGLAAGEIVLPDGVVVDPICGMQVRLGPRAITIEHDSTTVGFCARACRGAYARQHGLPVPA